VLCSALWTQGDGCNGGYVLFPCGLPNSTFGALQDSFQDCAESYAPALVHCYVDHTGRSFRRVKGHKDMPALVAALRPAAKIVAPTKKVA
jgi:hypothetical protein